MERWKGLGLPAVTLGLALGLGACRSPKPAPAARPAPAKAQNSVKPQFIYASWSQTKAFILEGRVIQTVSGQGGLSLILADHTWVHPVARPDDPLPLHPLEFVFKNAPNAQSIRHSTE